VRPTPIGTIHEQLIKDTRMDSKSIYTRLCESRRPRVSEYGRGSGLHKHHIVPRHSGGTDDISNLTYLTVREHILAHRLLWRIHRNPNDLRAMHMLGVKLTSEQRRITGEFCRDNGVGIHGAPKELRLQWTLKGLESQKNSSSKNTWWYWSTEEGRRERASMGGKSAHASGNAWNLSKVSKERHSEIAAMGGKSLKGRKAMHRPGDESFIRVAPEDIDKRIEEGYVFGSPRSPRKGKSLAWIHNNDLKVSKLVERTQLDSYLSQGWSRGRSHY